MHTVAARAKAGICTASQMHMLTHLRTMFIGTIGSSSQ
jgi:hypothetical protein